MASRARRSPDPTVAGLARTVISFMESLGIDKAHLVGHSLGGAIAMEVARSAPARVKSLILVSSAGLGPEINIDYIDGFIAANARRDLKDLLGTLFADQSLVSRQMIDEVSNTSVWMASCRPCARSPTASRPAASRRTFSQAR